jgi:hypothetical protein
MTGVLSAVRHHASTDLRSAVESGDNGSGRSHEISSAWTQSRAGGEWGARRADDLCTLRALNPFHRGSSLFGADFRVGLAPVLVP